MFKHKQYPHMKTNMLRGYFGESQEETKSRLENDGWVFPSDFSYDETRRVFISKDQIENEDIQEQPEEKENVEMPKASTSIKETKPVSDFEKELSLKSNLDGGKPNFKKKKVNKKKKELVAARDTSDILEEEAE